MTGALAIAAPADRRPLVLLSDAAGVARARGEARERANRWIRHLVLDRHRDDVLAAEVLGYDPAPLHLRMMRHVHAHPWSMVLAFRGAAKTTYCTVVRSIGILLRNPNARIVIASRVTGNSQKMLREIRAHFEKNDRLREVFGDWVGDTWGETQIIVNRRTRWSKEPSITALGIDSGVASQHYDHGMADDIMDEENSQTGLQRDECFSFWNGTFLPTIDPRGTLQVHGTRWHPQDIYQHLLDNEMSNSTLVIPVLDTNDRSTWEAQFSTEAMLEKRRKTPAIFFNSQYQCDATAMKGAGIIHVDWCQRAKPEDVPPEAPRFMGVDLAAAQHQKADKFAMDVIAVGRIPGTTDGRSNVWNLAFYEDRLTFAQQKKKIVEWIAAYRVTLCGIEANAYQAMLADDLLREYPHLRRVIVRVYTLKDARSRIVKLSHEFEDRRWWFLPGQESLINQLVTFEGKDGSKMQKDDGVDATEIARQVSLRADHRRPRRTVEPGLL